MADTTIGSLIVQLEANTAKLDEQIKASKAHFTGLSDAIGNVKNALLGLGVFEGLKALADVAAENEKAQALLKSQIKATGDAAHLSAGQLTEMAESLQGVTTYSHEQIESVEAQMLAFTNITGAQFKRTLQVVLDFATVTGRDASEAVRTLGQAINNPISSMGRLTQAGISLDQATKDQIKSLQEHGQLVQAQNLLLTMLEKSYGGAAVAARDTLGGALTGLKNDAQDLLDGDGGLNSVTDGVKQLDATLRDPDVKSGIQALVAGLMELVAATGEAAAGFLKLGAGIGEFFASAVAGGNLDNMAGIISNLKVEIASLQDQIARSKDESANGGLLGKLLAPDVDKLEAKLAQAKLQLQGLMMLASSAAHSDTSAVQQSIPGLADLTGAPDFKTPHIEQMPDIKGFGETGKANPYEQMLADQQEVMKIWEQNDPGKALQDQIDKTKALVGTVVNGEIFTSDDASKHIQDLKDEFGKDTDQMSEFAKKAADNIQTEFADGLFNNFHNGLRGMLEDWAKTLEKMADQLIASDVMNKLFGGSDPKGGGSGTGGLASILQSGLSNLFGGSSSGHAGGGVMSAGDMSPVNENGPELFSDAGGRQWLLAGSDGSVTPAGNFGGGGSAGNISVNMDLRGAGPDEVSKLNAMRMDLENSLKQQVEYRIQRGSWMRGRKSVTHA